MSQTRKDSNRGSTRVGASPAKAEATLADNQRRYPATEAPCSRGKKSFAGTPASFLATGG